MKRITALGFLAAALLVSPMAALAGGAPGPSVLSAHPYGGASVLGIHQGFATPGPRHHHRGHPAHVAPEWRQHHRGHPAYVAPPRHPVWVQPQWMWNGWQWVWVAGYWGH